MQTVLAFACVLLLTIEPFARAQSALQRGQPCSQLPRSHPLFRQASKACDSSKGLECMTSYNPEYTSPSSGSTYCDCPEDYYFDQTSSECRIQVGYACDPSQSSSQNWETRCPQNAYCSTNIGRYGPRGAKGMCRCKEGYYVSSIWFTEGGGSVCEKENEPEVDYAADRIVFDNDLAL